MLPTWYPTDKTAKQKHVGGRKTSGRVADVVVAPGRSVVTADAESITSNLIQPLLGISLLKKIKIETFFHQGDVGRSGVLIVILYVDALTTPPR